MNNMPTYEELLAINEQLQERCNELELIIQNQELSIQEFLAASTLYRELWMELKFNTKKKIDSILTIRRKYRKTNNKILLPNMVLKIS